MSAYPPDHPTYSGYGYAAQPPPPPSRRPVWPWIVGGIAVLVALVIVGGILVVAKARENAGKIAAASPSAVTSSPTVRTKVVSAKDGASQVTVPESWRELQLNDKASLQVGSGSREQYLIVISENKSDFDLSLDRVAKLTVGQMKRTLKNGKVGTPKKLTIDGRKAIQYEISGTVKGVRVVYWHTTIEGSRNFHQVITWTLASKAVTNGPLLRQVITTFKDTKRG